ncbi:MAG: hypothetical protein V1790_13875 [Planctomycetota bacterium]
MGKSNAQDDVWTALEGAIESFEKGLGEYETQVNTWSEDRRKLMSRETAMAEERTSSRARDIEQRAEQLAREQTALEQGRAELAHFKEELEARLSECEQRERRLQERENSLNQTGAAHEQAAASLEERTRQLDERQGELEARFEGIRRELEERRNASDAAQKEFAEQRQKFDHDHQDLARFRDELSRRESELASQSSANQETQQQLARRGQELEATQRSLAAEGEKLATRWAEVERRTVDLASLETQVKARQAEIDAGRRRAEDEAQGLKKHAEDLAERERELEQTAARFAKQAAEHQATAQELERRERELADATQALASRAEGLDGRRNELDAKQQALETSAREHQKREQELSEALRRLESREAKLNEADGRAQADRQAQLHEREQLAAARKSLDAESVSKARVWAEKDAELLAARKQMECDRQAAEEWTEALDQRKGELEARSKTLAEREGQLNAQQRELEAALQNLHNDRAAVEKARRVVGEVDESRWSELGKLRAESNALRTEIELSRTRERELAGSLGKAEAAHAREMHAAEDARVEAKRLAVQLDEEKKAAAERQAAIERREQEVLTLLEEVEAKSTASPNAPDGVALLAQRQASQAAVAAFWAEYKIAPQSGPGARATGRSKQADPPARNTAAPDASEARTSAETAPVEPGAAEEPVDTQASAMRDALAAARAEVEAAKREEPSAVHSGPRQKSTSNGRKRKAANTPQKFTRDLAGTAPELPAPQPAAVVASIDLDPDTANRLRMLRRLNPSKSDAELLARITAESTKAGKPKQKKSWFALK